MKISNYYFISVLLVVILVGLSFGLYSIEAGHPGAQIDSFGDALWYMLVTMTTVGYGDDYPVSRRLSRMRESSVFTHFFGRDPRWQYVIGDL